MHLGIAAAPNKSSLAYANRKRPAKLYEELFYTALARFREEQGLGLRKHKFRFKNKLLSLDSTARWSLSNLACMLRLNLFTYRDLTAWLDNPFGTPPIFPVSQQLALGLT